MKHLIVAACIALASVSAAFAEDGRPSDYGRVTINNYSEDAGMAPVVFDHWLHRAIYTCRLCHVDIGFAMQENGTNITKADNFYGFYCGACHNGHMQYKDSRVFGSCSDTFSQGEYNRCDLCHSAGKDVKKKHDFDEFTAGFPKEGFGNGLDWEKAEADGFIKPIDYIEGVSIKRAPLKPQEDFSIRSKGTWMTDVIFSHEKHAVWNGCEVCHPEIFPSVDRGSIQYSMLDIYNGEYCGVCHNRVAFPLRECSRCHINPVEEP